MASKENEKKSKLSERREKIKRIRTKFSYINMWPSTGARTLVKRKKYLMLNYWWVSEPKGVSYEFFGSKMPTIVKSNHSCANLTFAIPKTKFWKVVQDSDFSCLQPKIAGLWCIFTPSICIRMKYPAHNWFFWSYGGKIYQNRISVKFQILFPTTKIAALNIWST